MRILVTGAAGFLGYHLCSRLLDDGHQVVGLDNLLTGQRINAESLSQRPDFSFISADLCTLTDPATVRSLGLDPATGRFDQVYNMACPASPIDFRDLGIEIIQVCCNGTLAALQIARDHGAAFLQASTSECYGDPQVHPQTEDYFGNVNCTGPRAVYDEGKRLAEAMTMYFHRKHGLNTHLVRIFNTYGPRMRPNDGRALPAFINQALLGQPLTVHGQGQQTRSFCYCTDLIDGIVRLNASSEHLPVNIGNPDEVKIIDVAQEVIEAVAALTGRRSEIAFHERMQDDPELRRPDISKAARLLGWTPRVRRAEGLTRTVEWFASQMQDAQPTR